MFAFFIPESFPEISAKFSENFLKNLVTKSIKLFLRICQILVIVYPTFSENFLVFLEFTQIFIKISSLLNISWDNIFTNCRNLSKFLKIIFDG